MILFRKSLQSTGRQAVTPRLITAALVSIILFLLLGITGCRSSSADEDPISEGDRLLVGLRESGARIVSAIELLADTLLADIGPDETVSTVEYRSTEESILGELDDFERNCREASVLYEKADLVRGTLPEAVNSRIEIVDYCLQASGEIRRFLKDLPALIGADGTSGIELRQYILEFAAELDRTDVGIRDATRRANELDSPR